MQIRFAYARSLESYVAGPDSPGITDHPIFQTLFLGGIYTLMNHLLEQSPGLEGRTILIDFPCG
jgi:hypothetical protein